MLAKALLDLSRPFLRHSPRYTGFVYRALGGHRNTQRWARYGRRMTRCVENGYRMVLDLGNWSQRMAYYHGRFYERDTVGLIPRLLRPGDAFVDVGANIGLVTLSGAAAVGPGGTVLAFEPNPEACTHLREHLEINGLSWVQVFETALSNVREEGRLCMPNAVSGQGTLRKPAGPVARAFEVKLAPLDDFAAMIPEGRRLFIKIDTEGYELNVLQGARDLLQRDQTFVLTEVTDHWLRALGQSAEMLFAFMGELGYRAYRPSMRPCRLHQDLVIEPVTLPGPRRQFNALFAREGWHPDELHLQGRA